MRKLQVLMFLSLIGIIVGYFVIHNMIFFFAYAIMGSIASIKYQLKMKKKKRERKSYEEDLQARAEIDHEFSLIEKENGH